MLYVFLMLIVSGVPALVAQQDVAGAAAKKKTQAEARLAELRLLLTQVPQFSIVAQKDVAKRAQLRSEKVVQYLTIADGAKAFREEFPAYPKMHEARALEVESLLRAVGSGDTASETRLDLAVGELRVDSSMLPRDRSRIVGTYLFSRAVRSNKSSVERIAAIEQEARNLISEFPQELQGYESLLNVALGSDDEKYRTLLFDLWRSAAPAEVKLRVRTLMDRHFLTGEKISTLLMDAGESTLAAALSPKRPTIIYAWEVGNEASMVFVEALTLRKLNGVNMIGLCLNANVAEAKRLTEKMQLPGTQHFDDRGRGGALAVRLKIDSAPVLILVSPDGLVADTRGEYSFDAKLAKLRH